MTEPSTRTSILGDAALLFALCGFAIAQPLFDLLGKNPTFFVAHDLDGTDVVVLAILVVVVPPVALFAALSATRLAAPVITRVTRALLAGVLIALIVLPPVERAIGMSTTAWIVVLALLAVAAAFAYDQLRHLRLFLTFLAPAPLLFLVVFVLFTPVHTLIFATDPAAAAVDLEGTQTPVVVVVFDEFPLGVLLDEDGAIDATRFPGFARLADVSTWYPHATTVSGETLRAVPAILTGDVQDADSVPIAAASPHSLFTLFARSHDLHVTEPVTRLCPRELCGQADRSASTSDASVGSDLRTVFLHTLLPEDTATEWGIPTIGDRWAGFDEDPAVSPSREAAERSDFETRALSRIDSVGEVLSFDRFVTSLEAADGKRPGLWFQHALLPHVPYSLLPDGRWYNDDYVPQQSFANTTDVELVEVDVQRLVLQTLAVDHLVSRLVDRLERSGLLEDALVVVVADHGVSLAPGEGRRGVDTAASRDGVMPVPLFVRYPGQARGQIELRDARTIDVLPTIVDALGIDLPKEWQFDGSSLLGRAPSDSDDGLRFDDAIVTESPHPQRVADDLATFLFRTDDPRDPFRVGPYGDVVGSALSDLGVGSRSGFVSVDGVGAFDDLALDGELPVMLQATVTGIDADEWLAVVVNGTVAGVGPTFPLGNRIRFVAVVDPSLLRAGANTLALYRVDADRTFRPLTLQR